VLKFSAHPSRIPVRFRFNRRAMAVLLHGWLLAISVMRCSATSARSREEASPVQKVIGLLDSMSAKVTKNLAEQQRDFQLFASHCDKESTAKNRAVSDGESAKEELSAYIAQSTANIGVADTQVSEFAQQISDVEGELRNAASIRAKGNADFQATEKELSETVDSLSRASLALSKQGVSFAQMSGKDQEQMDVAIQDLGMIIEATWVTQQQKDSISAFLQQREDTDDDDMNDKALTEASPDGKQVGITETIADMEQKAQGSLSNARKEEMQAQHSFQMLQAGMNNELLTVKKELAMATQKKQGTIQDMSQSQKELDGTNKSLKEGAVFLKDLKHECQTRAGEFEAISRDAQAELDAMAKAKAILTNKFGAASFLQTSMKAHLRSTARMGMKAKQGLFYGQLMEGNKMQALKLIDSLGRKLHSMALVSLAFRAASDPFGKIRSMIEEMLAKLMQEAAEEADQKAFCDKELAESEQSNMDKNQKLDTLDARLGKLSSMQARLTQQVTTLTREVLEIDGATKESTEIRQRDRGAFEQESKDFQESQDACAGAIQALQEYYEGSAASFVQVRMRSGEADSMAEMMQQASGAAAQGGEGIIGLLEVVESDFATMLAETKAGENTGAEEFEKSMQESRVLKATKLTEAKQKESELKSVKTTLDEFSQDKEGVQSELDAVEEYLSRLKPECQTQVPTHQETKARRLEEIDGLRNALSVLEGTGI